jgi:hypothetical protein
LTIAISKYTKDGFQVVSPDPWVMKSGKTMGGDCGVVSFTRWNVMAWKFIAV